MTAVTPTDLMVSADLMIQFDIELPRRIGRKDDLAEIDIRIDCTLNVGVRIKVQNRLADRIDLVRGDYVVQGIVPRALGVADPWFPAHGSKIPLLLAGLCEKSPVRSRSVGTIASSMLGSC